jgi:hypothetical protein
MSNWCLISPENSRKWRRHGWFIPLKRQWEIYAPMPLGSQLTAAPESVNSRLLNPQESKELCLLIDGNPIGAWRGIGHLPISIHHDDKKGEKIAEEKTRVLGSDCKASYFIKPCFLSLPCIRNHPRPATVKTPDIHSTSMESYSPGGELEKHLHGKQTLPCTSAIL